MFGNKKKNQRVNEKGSQASLQYFGRAVTGDCDSSQFCVAALLGWVT